MIIHLKSHITAEEAQTLADKYAAVLLKDECSLLVTSSKVKEADAELQSAADKIVVTDSDIQLAGRQYLPQTRTVAVGDWKVGGNTNNTLLITGPCSVESEAQIEAAAQLCAETGVKVLRAGCYKPRTSPYTFQGLGLQGLLLLNKMREQYGVQIITEIRDSTHADEVIAYADIIQVGAKAMYDQGVLRKCGKSRKPVLLKRGFGSTLQEFVQAAEFVLCGGNSQVMLCERGIRTFETKTRFTLDLCGAVWLKNYTNLPIVIDPSHAIGFAYGVADLSRAAMALGIDGLLIETHPNPKQALSDAEQQLNFEEFKTLHNSLGVVAEAVGRKLI